MKPTIIGVHPLATDEQGRLLWRIGTVFPYGNVIVNVPGLVHIKQRETYVDRLERRAAETRSTTADGGGAGRGVRKGRRLHRGGRQVGQRETQHPHPGRPGQHAPGACRRRRARRRGALGPSAVPQRAEPEDPGRPETPRPVVADHALAHDARGNGEDDRQLPHQDRGSGDLLLQQRHRHPLPHLRGVRPAGSAGARGVAPASDRDPGLLREVQPSGQSGGRFLHRRQGLHEGGFPRTRFPLRDGGGVEGRS